MLSFCIESPDGRHTHYSLSEVESILAAHAAARRPRVLSPSKYVTLKKAEKTVYPSSPSTSAR